MSKKNSQTVEGQAVGADGGGLLLFSIAGLLF
jgi:hypothetical protein